MAQDSRSPVCSPNRMHALWRALAAHATGEMAHKRRFFGCFAGIPRMRDWHSNGEKERERDSLNGMVAINARACAKSSRGCSLRRWLQVNRRTRECVVFSVSFALRRRHSLLERTSQLDERNYAIQQTSSSGEKRDSKKAQKRAALGAVRAS